jgi:Flp pilus assembly pilin Flp
MTHQQKVLHKKIPPPATTNKGQSLGEYGLVLIIIFTATVLTMGNIGQQITSMFTNFNQQGFSTSP